MKEDQMNSIFEEISEVEEILDEITAELARARAKFSGDNATFAAMAEEFGEVATALMYEPRANLRAEAVQLAVMAIRLVLDGDHTFDKWRAAQGLDPIKAPIPLSRDDATGDDANPRDLTRITIEVPGGPLVFHAYTDTLVAEWEFPTETRLRDGCKTWMETAPGDIQHLSFSATGPRDTIERKAKKIHIGRDPVFSTCRKTGAQKAQTESLAEGFKPMPKARRVTADQVDAAIADEQYHVFPGSRHTVCTLTLHNGFAVTGESACADPAAFDPDLGRDLAKGKAREKVFELLAFLLREELHRDENARRTAAGEITRNKELDDQALIRAVMAQVGE